MDLTLRRPVWAALSDLFLDTDVTLSKKWRVEKHAESPYTVEELEWILRLEVYPVCKFNLLSVAGVWTGFQMEWLEEQILRQARSRFRFLWSSQLGFFSGFYVSEWQEKKAGIQALRSGHVAPAASQETPDR